MIVEVTIADVDDVGAALAERIVAVFAAKYNGYRTAGRGFFILTPRLAFGWSQFPNNATRWQFDDP